MLLRELPASVERVMAAARRIHPDHGSIVTAAFGEDGPPWEFFAFRRWLVLRTEEPERILVAVAGSVLARDAWLGKGALTQILAHLNDRYLSNLDALLAALDADGARAARS
jgi:hypothetical protein